MRSLVHSLHEESGGASTTLSMHVVELYFACPSLQCRASALRTNWTRAPEWIVSRALTISDRLPTLNLPAGVGDPEGKWVERPQSVRLFREGRCSRFRDCLIRLSWLEQEVLGLVAFVHLPRGR